MPVKAAIFDFDGTIADSFDVFLETLSELLNRPNNLSPEELTILRGLTTKQIARRVGIRPWQLPKLLIRGRQRIATKMDHVTAFDGVPRALQSLHDGGITLLILSSNGHDTITRFLDRYGLTGTIDKVYADTGLSGKSKALKKLIKQERLTIQDCVYIGDEIRDVAAAKKIGMPVVAVSWGYSTAEALKAYKPQALIDTPEQLLEMLNR